MWPNLSKQKYSGNVKIGFLFAKHSTQKTKMMEKSRNVHDSIEKMDKKPPPSQQHEDDSFISNREIEQIFCVIQRNPSTIRQRIQQASNFICTLSSSTIRNSDDNKF